MSRASKSAPRRRDFLEGIAEVAAHGTSGGWALGGPPSMPGGEALSVEATAARPPALRPGFRPILPRVHRGIGGNEFPRCQRCRSILIVPLECGVVVFALVAEDFTERRKIRVVIRAIFEKAVPVVVRHLVAKMPDERT